MTKEKVNKPFYARLSTWAIAIFIIGGIGASLESDDTAEQPNESQPVNAEVDDENTPKETETTVTIEQSAIDDVIELIKSETLVNDAAVIIDEDKKKISLAIVVSAAITEDAAKNIADNFVRQLASRSNGDGPTKDYLGGLWDEYDLLIAIGTSADDIKWSGAKVTSSPKITW